MTRAAGGLVVCLLFVCAPVLAQSDGYLSNSNNRGFAPENTFQIGDIDNVNLASGGLNLHIPLYSRKGRAGLNVTAYENYTSKFWIQIPNWDPITGGLDGILWQMSPSLDFSFQTVGGRITENEQDYECVYTSGREQYNYLESIYNEFMYRGPDGASYRFPNQHIDVSPNYGQECVTGVPVINQGVSDEGGMLLDTTTDNYVIYRKDGTKDFGGSVTDTNGNELGVQDTVGRSIPTLFGISRPFTITDSNGDSQTFTFTFGGTWTNTTTQFPTQFEDAAPVSQASVSYGGTRTLTLPNGRAYVFSFGSDFGEVTQVTVPTGGYIRYEYTTIPLGDNIVDFRSDSCPLAVDSRRVSARFISATGLAQDEKEWQYAYSGNTTTVSDPLGNDTVYTFATDDSCNPAYQTQVVYWQGSSTGGGTKLKTVATVWQKEGNTVAYNQKDKIYGETNWRPITVTTTLNDTNQVKQESSTYDTYTFNNATESLSNLLTRMETDWGNGAPGSVLRYTIYSYLNTSNSNYSNRHIDNRVSSKTIYDSTASTCQGLSQPCAHTTYSYDGTTIEIGPSLVETGGSRHAARYAT